MRQTILACSGVISGIGKYWKNLFNPEFNIMSPIKLKIIVLRSSCNKILRVQDNHFQLTLKIL